MRVEFFLAIGMMVVGAIIAYANLKDSEGSKTWGLIGILLAALGLYLMKDEADRKKHADQTLRDWEYRWKTEKHIEGYENE